MALAPRQCAGGMLRIKREGRGPRGQMRPQALRGYIRTQGIIAAIINAVLNPGLAWLGNRQMEVMTLGGDRSLVLDTAITSIVMSLLVTLCVTWGVQRDLKAGRLTVPRGFSRNGGLLSRLPRRAWALGLVLGVGLAILLASLILAVCHLFGLSGVPFVEFATLKAVYSGLLGFVVTRWVIFRQLLLVPQK